MSVRLRSRSAKLTVIVAALLLALGACSDDPPPAGGDSGRDAAVDGPGGGGDSTVDGPGGGGDSTVDGPVGDGPTGDITSDGTPADSILLPDVGNATPTAFRVNSLKVVDPHVYLTGCGVDITDLLNPQIDGAITADGDNDNDLDLNFVIVFRPLTQPTASGTIELADGTCPPPHPPTSCSRTLATQPALAVSTYSNKASGTCLGRTANGSDVSRHNPTETTGPCFASTPLTINLTLAGINIRLRDTQIAGKFDTNPATGLTEGLLRGFLTQADAQAATLPATLPIVGGRTLASLLCASGNNNDADTHPTHGAGWWFFLNYTAGKVSYSEQ